MVLAAGQFTLRFIRSSLALSLLAPQEGNRFRSASTSFSISADVAYPDAKGQQQWRYQLARGACLRQRGVPQQRDRPGTDGRRRAPRVFLQH